MNVGKNEYFTQVFDAHYTLLMRVVYRITGREDVAEEIVQEAFIKYYERVDILPRDEGVKYWLLRVVRNLALNYEKRRGRERKAVEKFFHETRTVSTHEGESSLLKQVAVEEVQAALLEVPYNLRIVLILKEYAGFNYQEIAQMLGITEGNVKVRVHRARTQLGQHLNKGEV
ncbi:MAG: hypothetical protein A2Z96_07315 [Spirochaetes bacterium GWB1_48_6]|nr:MAG: hypothetical protein A2Z96_07315 [Spirochaetes bacterium GWB1_48_6]